MLGLRDPSPKQISIMDLAGQLAHRPDERAGLNDPLSRFPHENYPDLHESGLPRLALPEQYFRDRRRTIWRR